MCKKFKYYLSQCPFSVPKDQNRLNTNIIISSDQSHDIHELITSAFSQKRIWTVKTARNTQNQKDVKTTKVNANGQGISQTPHYEIQTYWWKCAQENTFTLSPCFLLQTHTQNVIIINNMCMMIQITVNTPWMHKSIVRTLIGRLRAALLPSHQQWPKPVRTPHWPSNSNWVKKHKWLTKCSNSASQLQKANKKWVNRLTLPLSLWQQ